MTHDRRLYAPVAATSLVFFGSLFRFVSPRISAYYFKSYGKLSKKLQVHWDTRIGSNVHAVLVSSLGMYCFLFDEKTFANPILNDAVLIKYGIAITLGYMIADLLIIVVNYNFIGDVYMFVHHLASLLAYCCVLDTGLCPYFANIRQLAEFSTPFVNQRWYYDAIGRSRSSCEFIRTAWGMGLSFFICRIAVMPWFYYMCYKAWFTPEKEQQSLAVIVYLLVSCIILDVLNVYWFHKMAKGAYKMVQNMKSEKKH